MQAFLTANMGMKKEAVCDQDSDVTDTSDLTSMSQVPPAML
jgi:hypothetical protein